MKMCLSLKGDIKLMPKIEPFEAHAFQDEEKQREVLDKIAKELPQISINSTPPEMGRRTHKIVRQIAGSSDPCREIKDKYNKIALGLYPELRERLRKAKDSLLMSIRLAIAGNIIDFAVKNAHIDIEKEVEQILKRINLSFFYLKQNVL